MLERQRPRKVPLHGERSAQGSAGGDSGPKGLFFFLVKILTETIDRSWNMDKGLVKSVISSVVKRPDFDHQTVVI